MNTPKQRMLNAYRGLASDRTPVAPEFCYYYPAKLLGVDMIALQREVPMHLALKTSFESFGCEGWGAVHASSVDDRTRCATRETWGEENTLDVRTTWQTPAGELTLGERFHRQEPSWIVERPVKNLKRDLAAWELLTFGREPEALDVAPGTNAWREVGESYLLEFCVGAPFFDFWAGWREGGFETAIYDFSDPGLESYLLSLQARYTERLVRLARTICERTPFESLFIGCSWSCVSLLGLPLWRRWDKPVIKAVADEAHRHGRLLHVHFHGKCMDALADFADMGADCVCPFERPPGGDVAGRAGLDCVRRSLAGRVTMNGNVHTVETLIRGTPEQVRAEVREIREAFAGNNRLIIGTGDQVGRETPRENLEAMIEEGRR